MKQGPAEAGVVGSSEAWGPEAEEAPAGRVTFVAGRMWATWQAASVEAWVGAGEQGLAGGAGTG